MRHNMYLEELQETVGLIENETGIVYLSLLNTDLYDLLLPYISTVDYRLYFEFANRIVRKKFQILVSTSKEFLIHRAIYYALKGEEYNLKTLIETTNLDYNPLENYELHEMIVTTASISANMKFGELQENSNTTKKPYDVVTSTSYSSEKLNIEKSMPERQEHTTTTYSKEDESEVRDSEKTTGEQENIKIDSINYAQVEKTTHEDTEVGVRKTTTDNEHKVSAYNNPDYQPSYTDNSVAETQATLDTTNGRETTSQHVDVHDITDTQGQRIDRDIETTQTVKQEKFTDEVKRISEITDIDTHTYDPHDTTQSQKFGAQTTESINTVLEHENENKQEQDENKQRDLHGRYGFNTVQTMIESERRLANLNISDKIIDIVLHTICEGVLYLW